MAPYEIKNKTQTAGPATVSTTSKRAETRLEGCTIHDSKLESVIDLSPLSSDTLLTHSCLLDGRKSAMWIAQPSETVSEYRINKAADEAKERGFGDLVIAAFGYEEATRPSKMRDEGIRTWCVVLPVSLTISETEAEKAYPPVLLAEPVVSASDEGNGRISLIVEGFTTWNPKESGNIGGGDASEVACIMVDTNYDRIHFNAKRIQFPKPPASKSSDPYRKALDRQVEEYRLRLEDLIDGDAWEFVRSTKCIPFKPPINGAVAIRIITTDGDTLSRVIESEELRMMLEDVEA